MKPPSLLRSCLLGSAVLSVAVQAAPTLSVVSPAPDASPSSLSSVSITFSEPVSGVEANDLLVNAEGAGAVSGNGAGPYVFTFTEPDPGVVSVSWDFDHGIAGTAGTGAYEPTSGWTYTLTDTVAPTVAKLWTSVLGQEMDAVVPSPGATVDSLTQAEVTFSEAVSGVNASDLLVNGSPAASVTGADAGPYVFTFTQPAAGGVDFRVGRKRGDRGCGG